MFCAKVINYVKKYDLEFNNHNMATVEIFEVISEKYRVENTLACVLLKQSNSENNVNNIPPLENNNNNNNAHSFVFCFHGRPWQATDVLQPSWLFVPPALDVPTLATRCSRAYRRVPHSSGRSWNLWAGNEDR
jgi:hypothetical protein